MRVSELAKSLALPAGIVLKQAKAMKLDVTTTFSSLDPKEVLTLRAHYESISDGDRQALVEAYETTRKSRRSQSEATRVEALAKTREAIAEHLRIAKEAEAKAMGKAVAASAPTATPKAEAPTPVKEAPKVEAQAPEAPKTEAPKAEAPKVEKPAAPAPK
ncbi:MAG: hypothetical protein Q4C03_06955, partial [bacterium]|nr:hypothetical protein [bacterium]